jgi:tetratricopeptide (TPR) repeat protein
MIQSTAATFCLAMALLHAAAAAAGQEPPAEAPSPIVLQAARPDLLPLTIPPLDALEAMVASQIRDALAQVERAGVGVRALAAAYGELGETLHAYELLDAAETSYVNASRLARESRWLHLRAYLCQQTGRFDDAAGLYADARRLDPQMHVLGIRLGHAYLALGRLADARREFESAAARYPAAAAAGLGEIALREGRFERAVTHFREALDRVPEATALHYSLAMAYRGAGRIEDARAHLERRGNGVITPADPVVEGLRTRLRGERALVGQGRQAFEAGDYGAAAQLFARAVDAAPASAAARTNLGLALARLGRASEAAAHLESALAIDAADGAAHAGLGMLLAAQDRHEDAVPHLRAAFASGPADAAVRRTLVASLVRLGRTPEAASVLEQALAAEPEDEGVVVTLAILRTDQGRVREAVALLRDAHGRFPDRQPTATTLARLLASSPDRSVRDGRRALEIAMRVYEQAPAPVHRETVALALAELGRCPEALDWMRRAVAEAKRAGDEAEAARLATGVSAYENAPCAP